MINALSIRWNEDFSAIILGRSELLVILLVILFRFSHPVLGSRRQELSQQPLRNINLEIQLRDIDLLDDLLFIPIDHSTIYQSITPDRALSVGHNLLIVGGVTAVSVEFTVVIELDVLFNVVPGVEGKLLLCNQVAHAVAPFSFHDCSQLSVLHILVIDFGVFWVKELL